jgi:hypothetical protein
MSTQLTIFDAAIEERIEREIIANTYNEYEAHMGWFSYLKNHLSFPFEAKCVNELSYCPLKRDDRVMVVGLNPKTCQEDMFVTVEWQDRTFEVALYQLEGINVEGKISQAITDWHYWVGCGCSL